MNENKTKLAVKIIGDQFGDIVQDVAKVLTEGDSCTLIQIVRAVNANITARNTSAALNINNTGLVLKQKKGLAMDFPTVRSALLILHQHNCLVIDKPAGSEFDPVVPQKDMKTGFVYSLNVTNILHRLHFARLLSIVKAKFGDLAVLIVETVMMFGKVRLDQIGEQVAQISPEPVSTTDIRETFEALVSNRFLVTVYPSPTGNVTAGTGPVIEIVTKKRLIDLDTPTAAETNKRAKTAATANAAAAAVPAVSKRRAVNANQLVKQETDDGIPVELRMLMGASSTTSTTSSAASAVSVNEASAGEVKKVTMPGARSGRGAGRGTGRGSGAAENGGRGTAAAGGRGGAGSFKQDTTISASSYSENAISSGAAASKLWTIGWDQFIRETRHAACVQVVTQLHASMAGTVVKTILGLSMNAESGSKQNKSGEVMVLDLFKQLERDGQLAHLPGNTKEDKMKMLRQLLEILRMSESAAVIKVVGSESDMGGPAYMVNIDRLVSTLQRRTIFTIASERFGFVSARIVELLQRHQYLEQQQVCDMALLPARETRERLYKLFLDKWINYIDLSKRNDFNPSTSFYFWYLDLPLLKSTIRDHVYQTMLNLTLRRQHESEQGRELLDREHLIDNEADRNRHARLMNRLNKLDLAIFKVDSTILLMEHF